jgi:predicted MPP superfamily phosphohydrolase
MKTDFQHYVIYRLFRRAYPTIDALIEVYSQYTSPTQPPLKSDITYLEALSKLIETGVKHNGADKIIDRFKEIHLNSFDKFDDYLLNLQASDRYSKECTAIAIAPTLLGDYSNYLDGLVKNGQNGFYLHEEVPFNNYSDDYEYLIEVAQRLKKAWAYFALINSETGLNRPTFNNNENEEIRRFWLANDFASFYSLVSNLHVHFFVRGSGSDLVKDDHLEYYKDPEDILTKVSSRMISLPLDQRGTYKTHAINEPEDVLQTVEILHISDLHFRKQSNVDLIANELIHDLKNTLYIGALKYIVVTGDITQTAEEDEYNNAFKFFRKLRETFQLPQERLLICPGNHDVNWAQGNKAYDEAKEKELKRAKVCEANLDSYWKRFKNFSDYTEQATGSRYPLDPNKQAIIHEFPEDQLLFLSLNSSWKIDRFHKGRTDINSAALDKALDDIENGSYKNWIKIALLHHPVCLPISSDKNYTSHGWFERLTGKGFKLILTGHVHESTMLSAPPSHGELHLIGVGTVNSTAGSRPESIPYQYNQLSLHLGTRTLRVRSRRKDSPEGSWWADARWGDNVGTNPRPEVSLQL